MKSLEIVNEVLGEDDWGILGREELEQIKQDLEVLEILKENLFMWYCYCGGRTAEIHTTLNDETTRKDFNKVKQWLEENENDR